MSLKRKSKPSCACPLILIFCFGIVLFCFQKSHEDNMSWYSFANTNSMYKYGENIPTRTDVSLWVLNEDVAQYAAKPPPVKLIIVSYRRSGSSFFGSLLHAHPEVFYIFEPLIFVTDPDYSGYRVSNTSVPINSHILPKRDWKNRAYVPDPLDFIRSLLNCHVTNATYHFLLLGGGSRDFNGVRDCLCNKRVKNKDFCFQNATRSCLTKSVTSVKTVRLSLEESGWLMAADPNIKVLYLTRDPRGSRNSLIMTLASRDKSVDEPLRGKPSPQKYGDDLLREKCRIMNEDVRILPELNQKFEGRILTVRYEDVADDSLGAMRKILKFLNLDMHSDVLQGIAYMTHNPNVTKTHYTRKRTNSSQTASMWRQQLDFEVAQKVQRECRPFMDFMQYRIFGRERDMRDLEQPFRRKEFAKGILHVHV